ncbi:MAG TPA: hypothetical protein VLM85_09835, partial [Polyangiaceae bacterium]|nr:hypothetical protein [Polyangiaceae bacterium]
MVIAASVGLRCLGPQTCERATWSCDDQLLPPHASAWTLGNGFDHCVPVCEPGFSDCDGLSGNGCETEGLCTDGGPAEKLAEILGAPRGLTRCDGKTFVLVDKAVYAIVSTSVLNEWGGTPAGGLTCLDDNVYWLSIPNPTVKGCLFRMPTNGGRIDVVATDLQPGPGVDVAPGDHQNIYWFGGGDSLMRTSVASGTTAVVMPASETDAVKGFTLSADGAYSIANGSIFYGPFDG